MDQMYQSLLIAAIGMGLVFILIVLLWGFMAALVMATTRLDFMAQLGQGDEKSAEEKVGTDTGLNIPKHGIIAVAVAAALATGQRVFHIHPTQPNSTSSWQAVTRANTLAQISAINNRKPRG